MLPHISPFLAFSAVRLLVLVDACDAAGSATSRSSRSTSLMRRSISGMKSGSSCIAVPT